MRDVGARALCDTRVRRALGAAAALALCLGGPAACDRGDATEEPPPVDVQPTYPYPLDDVLRFEHLQAKSTHNSYHVETPGNTLEAWHYSHAPLGEQLALQGVRHVEIDVRRDAATDSFVVYHLPIVDEQTTCRQFTDCLQALKSWSDGHRAHHPLAVHLESKDGTQADFEGYFAALHAAILSVWPVGRIVTPALVQGAHASLPEALATDGWPTLGELRGKILFTLDDAGEFRDAYTHGGGDLAGRLIFPNSEPGVPYAGYAVLNDPVAEASAIAAALSAHLLVRTRADGDVVEPLAGDTTRREAALASGAQFVSTDFPVEVPGVAYSVTIPGGTPTRCNPVTAPAGCTSEALEDPAFVGP
ncbi:MAG: hypothetical protein HY908_33910 [Myxococcales bacterium]|nr:hypothetical protein [Myxococcales bacterium]